MQYEELKQASNTKILARGTSGSGKTHTACKVALKCLEAGLSVKFVDTEAEGSTTLVTIIENGDYDKGIVENLDYVQVEGHEQFTRHISHEQQAEYDLLIVDTLDHKHTFALEKVNDDPRASEADWNQYPEIYDTEKQIMQTLAKPKCNLLATVDPDSGKKDKPKGAQTNVHGYFTAVIDFFKEGDTWSHKISNYVGKGHAIGGKDPKIRQKLADDIIERSER